MTRFIEDMVSNAESMFWMAMAVAILTFGGHYLWAKLVTRLRKGR